MVKPSNIPVSTVVTINGKTFDLKHMSAEKGAELMQTLNADDQQIAKSFGLFMMNYQSIISVELPEGMDIVQAAKDLFKEAKKTGGKISSTAAPHLQELAKIPGISTLVGATNTSMDIGAFMTDFFAGLTLNPTNVGNRIKDAAGESAKEFGNKLDSRFNHITQEQADAIGAAYAAAIRSSKENPALEVKAPDWADKALTRGETIFAHIGKFLKQHVPFIPAALKFVGKGFKDWDSCMTEAKSEADKEVTPYEKRLDEKMVARATKKARPVAAEMLQEAEEIAGVSTKNVSQMITNKNAYRDENGNVNQLEFDKDGKAIVSALSDDKGNPIKASDKASQLWEEAKKPGYLLGTAASLDAGYGLVRGMSSKIVGPNSALEVKGQKMFAEADKLYNKAIAAEQGVAPKKIAGIEIGGQKPNAALSDKLMNQAIEAEAKGNQLLSQAEARKNFLGKTKLGQGIINLAEKEAPTGSLRIMNRIGATPGKWLGGPVNGITSTIENTFTSGGTKGVTRFMPGEGTVGTIKAGTYVYDGMQGISDLMQGNTHGFLENGMQISSGYFGSQLTSSAAVEFLPGRFKMLAPVLGLFGFVGGRKGGELITEAVLDKKTTDADALEQINQKTTQSMANTDKLKKMHDEGKVTLDDDTYKMLRDFNENNKNAVTPGVKNNTLQVAGGL